MYAALEELFSKVCLFPKNRAWVCIYYGTLVWFSFRRSSTTTSISEAPHVLTMFTRLTNSRTLLGNATCIFTARMINTERSDRETSCVHPTATPPVPACLLVICHPLQNRKVGFDG